MTQYFLWFVRAGNVAVVLSGCTGSQSHLIITIQRVKRNVKVYRFEIEWQKVFNSSPREEEEQNLLHLMGGLVDERMHLAMLVIECNNI